MTDKNKEYEFGYEEGVAELLEAMGSEEKVDLDDLKEELNLGRIVEDPIAEVKTPKSKKQKTVKAEEVVAPVEKVVKKDAEKVVEKEIVQDVAEQGPAEQSNSQTQKKYGWMVNERSSKNRRYFTGKGTRH